MKYITFDVGGTAIKVEVLDEKLTSYYKEKINTPKQGNGETLTVLYEEIDKILIEFDIKKIGFSIPGAVNEDGTINWIGAVTDFKGINFIQEIKKNMIFLHMY